MDSNLRTRLANFRGCVLGPLPACTGTTVEFPPHPDALHEVRILVAIILRYPADPVGVPSGGCVSHTWHHYLGRNNSKGKHRGVRVPPNHPISSLFCNISKSCCVGFTESALEQHNERRTGHTI